LKRLTWGTPMQRLWQLGWSSAVLGLVLLGCVERQGVYESSRPSADVIELRLSYPEAFDRVVRLLEKEGYEVQADERTGLIRTAPKVREGSDGVSYKVGVVVRMGGTDSESWLTVDQIAVPTFPEDEKRLKNALKELAQ